VVVLSMVVLLVHAERSLLLATRAFLFVLRGALAPMADLDDALNYLRTLEVL